MADTSHPIAATTPSADFLDTVRSLGLVRQVEGRYWAVVGRVVDEISGVASLYIPAISPEALRSPAVLERIVRSISDSTDETVLIRTPGSVPGSALPASLARRPYLRYVWLATDRPPPRTGRVTVGRARSAEEIGFVAATLSGSYVDTYSTIAEPGLGERAQRYVERRLAEGTGLRGYVARHGAELVGHATVDRHATDDVTGVAFCELVDQHLLPAAPEATASELLAHVISECRTAGVPLVGKVNFESDEPDRILARLLAAGWRPAFDIWRLPGQREAAEPAAESAVEGCAVP